MRTNRKSHQHACSDASELITDIVDAVAEETGHAPTEMTPPLADVVDPSALGQIFQRPNNVNKIVFTYQGKEVLIDSGGHITVRDPPVE